MEKLRNFVHAIAVVLLAATMSLSLVACNGSTPQQTSDPSLTTTTISRDGSYTSKEDVSLYLHTYGKLPSNFISKTKARDAGWDPQKGNLDEVCPGKSIGGSIFYNDDHALPDAPGRTWHECDINYQGGHRGPERIVYSTDGLVYYTPDHYKTFEQL
jgi:hypothetical protein